MVVRPHPADRPTPEFDRGLEQYDASKTIGGVHAQAPFLIAHDHAEDGRQSAPPPFTSAHRRPYARPRSRDQLTECKIYHELLRLFFSPG